MTLDHFIELNQTSRVSFDQTQQVINQNYDYQPTTFSNGLGEDTLINEAGTNEGSCKIFAFAQIHNFDSQQTLNLFGDFYWQDVLGDPEGTGHQNIRNFIKHGWSGISFSGAALTAK